MPPLPDLLTITGSVGFSVGAVLAVLKWAIPRAVRAEAETIVRRELTPLHARLAAAEGMRLELHGIAAEVKNAAVQMERHSRAMEQANDRIFELFERTARLQGQQEQHR